MSLIGWILFLAAAAMAGAYALYVYRRREAPGRGRVVLAALRTLALTLLLLLVFNPELPSRDRAASRTPAILLDASLSMTLPATADGATRWAVASAEAARAASGSPVYLFEQTTRLVAPQTLADETPGEGGARLLPALRAAAEAGARRAVVFTDGVLEDAGEVARWLPALPLDVEFRSVDGESVRNRAIAELEVPSWAEAGTAIDVRFGVTAFGVEGDSALLRVEQDGQPLAEQRIVMPADGRVTSGTLSITPVAPAAGGYVQLDAVLTPADAVPADDRRAAFVYVSDEPAGITLVSFLPDWEPRFLEPVLGRTLGLPVRGYLRIGEEGYRRTGTGLSVGEAAAEAEVRRDAAAADLLVLHGVDAAAPAWARELAGSHRRVLVLAGPVGDDVGLPVRPGAPIRGEWFAADQPAASPVAALLAEIQTADAPPLASMRPVTTGSGVWTPLEVTLGRQGAPLPAAVAGETGGRRWALATGSGYWQWALRGDSARQLYTRFWGALAGWLARDRTTADGDAVRPLRRAVERGGSVAWAAPGLAADSFAIRLTAEDGAVRDTVLRSVRGDSVAQPAPPPGRYRYEITAYADDASVASGSGDVLVQTYSPEFSRRPVALADVTAGEVAVGPGSAVAGRPLRAGPTPYILIMLLLAAEWVLRRRWGLR